MDDAPCLPLSPGRCGGVQQGAAMRFCTRLKACKACNQPPGERRLATPASGEGIARALAAIFFLVLFAGFASGVAKAQEASLLAGTPAQGCLRFPREQDRMECVFRHAMKARHERRYRLSIRLLRAMLAQRPNLARVRLELAQNYFLIGNDDQAERHFRYALGGGLPAPVVQRVQQYLDAMRRRKNWVVSFDYSIAPQSNVNRATKRKIITAGGIPWTLDADSRKKAGLRVSLSADVLVRPWLAQDLRGHIRFMPSVSATTDGRFRLSKLNVSDLSFASHSETLAGELGLVFLSDLQELSAGISIGQTWAEGDRYLLAYGGWVRLRRELSGRLRFGADLALERLDHAAQQAERDGWELRHTASLRYQLTPWLAATLSAPFTWHRTKPRDKAYVEGGAGIGFDAILPHDFSLYLGATLKRARFSAQDRIFGKRRKDWFANARARLTWARFTAFDLAPYVEYSFERRSSTLVLHEYTNHAFLVGFSKTF